MEANNTAAIREALRTLRQRFDNNVMAYQDRYFKFSGWHWHKKAAEAARWRDVFHELREACDAALAAPARNCDWNCALMPRIVCSKGTSWEWNRFGGCSIADAWTGSLVYGRDEEGNPDMDALRKGVAQ